MAALAPLVMRTEHNFIRTFTGRKFWPLTPDPEQIDIEDIAHALANTCRWNGHVESFYSVAEHSIRVSYVAQNLALAGSRQSMDHAREVALWGLLHDASEAYLCDLSSPMKHGTLIGDLYRGFEQRLQDAIADRFHLMPHIPSVVHEADRLLLNTEARDLMRVSEAEAGAWQLAGERLVGRIDPMGRGFAEAEFLRRFHALHNARAAESIASQL